MAFRRLASFYVFIIPVTLVVGKGFVEEVRQNFEEKTNSDLVIQVAAFQRASLAYMAYASYFHRGDVHLPGFRKFFLAASEDALKSSRILIEYVNDRGGHLQFPIINMNEACKMMKVSSDLADLFPPNYTPRICRFAEKRDQSSFLKDKKKEKDRSGPEDWQSGLLALKDALLMERELNRLLLNLRSEAKNRNDYHLQEKVEQEFLGKQTEHIKKLADVIRRLELYEEADYPLGEYVTDLHLDS
ncbi:hypothetical protein C0Q70_08860 [Pomacea canaliculata]|uniref:Ferritin n=1 Tax=Pomacea canaliculata TaxID=400727 RepID=A0A2T7P849_POMCA|nr:yolk ferritin-like [Pomacea canaliculata]PVD29605.1 hypothetical protein C0Q70_08860 [Pomacea canaliculata]